MLMSSKTTTAEQGNEKMTVTAIYTTGSPVTVECDPWIVNAVVESFYETGAIAVSTK